ncbi:MAG: hypothetical protein LBB36_00910, partial [Fibromonadaceae bacterium]|nr:hypothetical protein [Fibromonadaceae bacterium]
LHIFVSICLDVTQREKNLKKCILQTKVYILVHFFAFAVVCAVLRYPARGEQVAKKKKRLFQVSANGAYYCYMGYNNEDVLWSPNIKSSLLSIRCVQD